VRAGGRDLVKGTAPWVSTEILKTDGIDHFLSKARGRNLIGFFDVRISHQEKVIYTHHQKITY